MSSAFELCRVSGLFAVVRVTLALLYINLFQRKAREGTDTTCSSHCSVRNWSVFRLSGKTAKVTVSFVVFVRVEHLGSHWTEFHQIRNLNICRKPVNFKVAAKCKYKWKLRLKRFLAWRVCTAAT